MRTTLTLDEDVAERLEDRCRRTGESFQTALNRVLRDGLDHRELRQPEQPFLVKARALGPRPGVQLDNIGELDGPGRQ